VLAFGVITYAWVCSYSAHTLSTIDAVIELTDLRAQLMRIRNGSSVAVVLPAVSHIGTSAADGVLSAFGRPTGLSALQ
jgi:hypothetical protein